MKIRSFSKTTPVFLIALCVLLMTPGCDAVRNYQKADRSGNKEIQDYRDVLAPRLPDPDSKSGAGRESADIPALQPYIAGAASSANSAPAKPMPVVSVSVNQSVPLRDVLFELAQQAGYDIELDPNITGSIIFTARDRPFDEVVQRIAESAGLRYKFEDNVLHVEVDTPYNKTYKIDYLSYVRKNKGGVNNKVGVVAGEGTDTGSDFQTATESEADFWGELEVNLKQIIGTNQGSILRTKADPKITATAQNPAQNPQSGQNPGQAANVQAVAATDANGNPVATPSAAAPQVVLNVQSLPTDQNAAGQEPAPAAADPSIPSFAINKQAGIISVYANDKGQREVADYLKLLRKSVTAQVLIEAKILEVALNDEYSTGIDWRVLKNASGEFSLNFLSDTASATLNTLGSSTLPLPSGTTIATNRNFVVGYAGDDVQALIQAISGFGTVHALASPRLTVLNNQSAVLNVANNRVFFDVDVDVTTQDQVTRTDVTSEARNVPEGVLINVQPSIDVDRGTISMAVRPTVTRIIGTKPDPAIQYITASNGVTGVQSLVPELNVQEIDSVIQSRSGQAIVMGGLLQDRATSTRSGIPVLNETPLIGGLFRNQRDLTQKTELVIFLKATILTAPDDSINDTDKDLYRGYSGDRRPLKL